MFDLHSSRLRRRLSAPSSGSLRRRARERRQAELTRLEGERLAREYRDIHAADELESQLRSRQELATYEPWGRAGGGAPNSRGIRFTNIRAKGIIPEDELRGVQLKDIGRYWSKSPVVRRRCGRRAPMRLREDPQLFYAENLKKAVNNDIRYRKTPEQQRRYKEILDDMVDQRYKAIQDEIKKNLDTEREMLNMDGPWGKPGPGGTTWRNPRDVGVNFSNSMGWTDNDTFNKIKREHGQQKRSSLTLPKVKKDDVTFSVDRDKENLENLGKLPVISKSNNGSANSRNSGRSGPRAVYKKGMASPKSKIRLSNAEQMPLVVPDDYYNTRPQAEEPARDPEKKITPESTILNMTGGVELVPLLARRRRVGARTLPSSDVTRPPEQSCEWREMFNDEHLQVLKHQMRIKCQQKEESRLDSAESVRRHHATWASLWGRPGHGAPQQRGRYARSNLARLLYVCPPITDAI